MLKRIFLAFLAAVLTTAPASAQSWNPGASDPGANWSVLSSKPTTGTFPADAFEPADQPLPDGVVESDWVISTGDALGIGYNVDPDITSGAEFERKIRIACEPAGAARLKDNILGYGVKRFGHPHQGYGSFDWNEISTYQTLRAAPRSNCSGGPMNASNYMEPAALKQLPNGAIVSVLADDQVNYYSQGNQSDPLDFSYVRAGTAFIMGARPTDFNDTRTRAELAAAGRAYPGGARTFAGSGGYSCSIATVGNGRTGVPVTYEPAQKSNQNGTLDTTKALFLRGPGGEDPFGGACVQNQYGFAEISNGINAPECWYAGSLTSPDGRAHFRHQSDGQCPTTLAGADFVKVPSLFVSNRFATTGFSDYGSWYFGTDRLRVSTTECPDAAAPCDGSSGGNDPATVNGVYYSRVSISACRSVGLDFCNMETMHADWTYGHKRSVFDAMQRNCLGSIVRGVASTQSANGAECGTHQMDRYNRLLYGAVPSGQRTWTKGCAALGECLISTPDRPLERYATVPDMSSGTVHIGH